MEGRGKEERGGGGGGEVRRRTEFPNHANQACKIFASKITMLFAYKKQLFVEKGVQ